MMSLTFVWVYDGLGVTGSLLVRSWCIACALLACGIIGIAAFWHCGIVALLACGITGLLALLACALLVRCWCIIGVSLVLLVQCRFITGTSLVLVHHWYIIGTSLVHHWYIIGTFLGLGSRFARALLW
jgi:hypothetical protein